MPKRTFYRAVSAISSSGFERAEPALTPASARTGRWVGLGYNDKIMTGWGSMAKTAEEAEAVIERLNQASGQVERG